MSKHISLFLFSFFISVMTMGQSLDDIRSLAGKNQWDKAKEGIDSYLGNENNAKRSEGWYLKALVYYNILKQDNNGLPAGYADAFIAYKKFLELKEKEKDAAATEHEILFGLTFNNIDKANNDFQLKRFEEALKSFREVEEMENFIVKKGFSYQAFSFPVYDTQLYVNIAAAAINAGKEDIAISYYQKIADNKITGKGFEGIYRFLADRFQKKGDKTNRDKYSSLGRELYPEDEFWCQLPLKDAGTDKKKLFARYEELIKSYCNNYTTNYNYAAELYNYCFKQTARPADFATQHPKIPEILKNALLAKATVEANLLMSRYQLNLINDLIDSYNKSTDAKKKDTYAADINQRYEQVYQYAGNAYNSIDVSKLAAQPKDKDNYISACKMLLDYWDRKKDKERVKEFQEKINAVN